MDRPDAAAMHALVNEQHGERLARFAAAAASPAHRRHSGLNAEEVERLVALLAKGAAWPDVVARFPSVEEATLDAWRPEAERRARIARSEYE